MSGLQKAKALALGHVNDICNETKSMATDCPLQFTASKWQPMVASVGEPMQALHKQLQLAIQIAKDKIFAQCGKAVASMTASCKDAAAAVDKVASKAKSINGAMPLAKVGELRKDL